MKPFRKNAAIAIDGGGIRGVICARAISILEQQLGKPAHQVFRLMAGTSTGSIISAAMASGLSGAQIYDLYVSLADTVFRRTWRSVLWPLSRYRYDSHPLEVALQTYIGDRKMGDFWSASPRTDVVITAFDLVENHTCFIKPWKQKYANWPVTRAVLASSTVPTYFPVVEGRFVDGGVGSYANPCYLAAYEARLILNWNPAETTLISLGTGREPHKFNPGEANHLWAWQWLGPLLGAFLQSADDQQVTLVQTFFSQIDFRRFQVDLRGPISMDDPSKISELTAYGEEMGRKVLADETDAAQRVTVSRPLRPV